MHKHINNNTLSIPGIVFLLFFFAFESCHTTDKLQQIDQKEEIKRRILLDFNKPEETIKEELLPYFPELSDSLLNHWEKTQKLEHRIIDGKKCYFRQAVRNLMRIDSMAILAKIDKDGYTEDPFHTFKRNTTADIIKNRSTTNKKFKINFSITLEDGIVPDGELVKCWLPFPRESHPRQSHVKLINTSQIKYVLADNSAMQRSLYMEQTVKKGKATAFSYSAKFETKASYFHLDTMAILPYQLNSELYKLHTAEKAPHLVFSDSMKKLAEEITGIETKPNEIVRIIYHWIDTNIPWASALEYSTINCIPQYVIDNKHGDCGMKTLLFMTLARIKGIPCKWQSGWMLHPGEKNLHDWCEVYYEGVGWVPLDQSFGLQDSEAPLVREFYMQGIDAYRLIINDDFSREFNPAKEFFRSEPIDFQRGELEWEGGNIYFNNWDYQLEVQEITE